MLEPARHGREIERATSGLVLRTPPSKLDGRAVWHNTNLVNRARLDLNKQTLRGFRHHDHTLRLLAELCQHTQLMGRRLRQHRMQRHDKRLGELLREREHVLAVRPAEDPVLVLENDDIDVEPAEQPRRPYVVTPNSLGHRRQDLRVLRARRLVDDDHAADVLDALDPEQRSSHVGREGSDSASTRRIRREDRGTHDARAPLSVGVRCRRRRTLTRSGQTTVPAIPVRPGRGYLHTRRQPRLAAGPRAAARRAPF